MQFRKNKNYNKASTNKTLKLNKIHLERYILTTSTIIGWSSYFSFYKNWIISSKRSKLFKNLIVEFKIDWFFLTLKYSDPYKRMLKSFSSGWFVRDEAVVYIYIVQEFWSNSRIHPATQEKVECCFCFKTAFAYWINCIFKAMSKFMFI